MWRIHFVGIEKYALPHAYLINDENGSSEGPFFTKKGLYMKP